jgi:hypothetical protein
MKGILKGPVIEPCPTLLAPLLQPCSGHLATCAGLVPKLPRTKVARELFVLEQL